MERRHIKLGLPRVVHQGIRPHAASHSKRVLIYNQGHKAELRKDEASWPYGRCLAIGSRDGGPPAITPGLRAAVDLGGSLKPLLLESQWYAPLGGGVSARLSLTGHTWSRRGFHSRGGRGRWASRSVHNRLGSRDGKAQVTLTSRHHGRWE